MIKAILFDFDGTLINSRQATIGYLQETFRQFDLRIPDEKELIPLFGYKVPDMLKQLLPDFTESQLQTIFEHSMKWSILSIPKIKLMPDVTDVLNKLKKNKYKLAVVTSRGKRTMKILLSKFHLNQYFEAIVDREDVQKHKPHPEGVLGVLKRLKISPLHAIYVGDARADIETAHNAGISCILISPVKENWGEDYHIHSIKELPSLMNKIINNS